jgi:thiosulfate reductase cytochrome b subunit
VSQRTPRHSRALRWIILGAGLVIIGIVVVLVARWMLHAPALADFFLRYDGTQLPPSWAPIGLPAWLGILHFCNTVLIGFIVVSGLRVRSKVRPSAFVTPKGVGRAVSAGSTSRLSLHVWWHLLVDTGWVLVGVVYVVLLFATGHWVRIVPTSWDVFPQAVSAGIQIAALQPPPHDSWVSYNALQLLAYFVIVFVVAPVSIVSGLRLSPTWRADRAISRVLTEARARRIHTVALAVFIVFTVLHVALVLLTGAVENLSHLYASSADAGWLGVAVFAGSSLAAIAAWTLLRPPAQTAIAERVADVRRMPPPR